MHRKGSIVHIPDQTEKYNQQKRVSCYAGAHALDVENSGAKSEMDARGTYQIEDIEKLYPIISDAEIEKMPTAKERKQARQKQKRQTKRRQEFEKEHAKRRKKHTEDSDEEIIAFVQSKLERRRKRKSRPFGAFILMFLGIALLLYPIVSDVYESYRASQSVNEYVEKADQLSQDEIEAMIAEATSYNHRLMSEIKLEDEDLNDTDYMDILDVTGTGIMGSVEIECIGVNQPIYHTVEENVLMNGTGHMQGTSFPLATGGSWAAIAGHTGMPGQRMFDELTSLTGGEIVKVKILDRKTLYRVEDCEVVEPDWQANFTVEEGVDRLTLITCTPYGINDHRLLVHCVAVPDDEVEEIENTPVENKLTKFLNMRTIPIIATILIIVVSSTFSGIKKIRKKRAQKKGQAQTESAKGK